MLDGKTHQSLYSLFNSTTLIETRLCLSPAANKSTSLPRASSDFRILDSTALTSRLAPTQRASVTSLAVLAIGTLLARMAIPQALYSVKTLKGRMRFLQMSLASTAARDACVSQGS